MAAGGLQSVRVAESQPLSQALSSRVHGSLVDAEATYTLLFNKPARCAASLFQCRGRGRGSAPPDDVIRASRSCGPRRRDCVTGARRGSRRDGGAGRGRVASALCVATAAAARVSGSGRSGPRVVLLGVGVLLSQPRLLLRGQPLCLEERAAQVRGLRARARARGRNPRLCEAGLRAELGRTEGGAALSGRVGGPPELNAPSVGTTLPSSSGASPVSWWCPVSRPSACYSGGNSQASRCKGGGAEGNRGEISGVFGGGSKTDAPFPVAQPGTSLLTLMGFRMEGIFPAALLPLLLTMVSPLSFFLCSLLA